MRSFFVAVVLLISCVLRAAEANACKFLPVDFDARYAQAETVFIGAVTVDEMGLAVFRTDKGLKGIGDGEEFSVVMTKASCSIRFSPGQVWLYLGPMQMSGSRLLMDEYGRWVEENALFVKEKFAFDATKSAGVVGGEIRRSCAPWDGPAVEINLANGVRVMIYKSLNAIEGKDELQSFTLTGEPRASGGGGVNICTAEKCTQHKGRVTLSSFDEKGASGQVEIEDGEHKILHVFRVSLNTDPAYCG